MEPRQLVGRSASTNIIVEGQKDTNECFCLTKVHFSGVGYSGSHLRK